MTHPMTYDYIPPGLYRFLTAKSGEEVLSLKELKIMFLRDWCERLGFKCEHPRNRITNANKDPTRPYCKECWRRLEKKEVTVHENGKVIKKTYFDQIETFVDRWNQDNKAKRKTEREPIELDEQVKQDLK